jgi:pseudouridine-5'-monophosphatase
VTIDEWIAERSKLHKEAFKGTKPLPGALELVRELKKREVPIAIATGSNNANYKWKTVRPPSPGS